MTARAPLAVASLGDFTRWARTDGIQIVVLVSGSILLARLASWLCAKTVGRIDRRDDRSDSLVRTEAAKHRHSLAEVITWSVLVLIFCVTGVLVIKRLGVPLTSLVAPATVAGLALGFGAQRVVQDVLAGFLIVAEHQYGFGDLIRISSIGATTGITGTVEEVTLRITTMRTVNGEVVIIPNGQINQVTNLSRDWARAVVDVPLPASVDISKVNKILSTVGQDAYRDEDLRPLLLDPPTVMGVESIDVGGFSIRFVARTLPGQQFIVGRNLRARVATALQEGGVSLLNEVGTDGLGQSA